MKHRKSQTVLERIMPIEDQARTTFYRSDIIDRQHLTELGQGITHMFSFWEGINMDAREAIAKLITHEWRSGGKMKYVAFVQYRVHNLDRYLRKLGFPAELRLIDSFNVKMLGQGSFLAYLLKFDPISPSVH